MGSSGWRCAGAGAGWRCAAGGRGLLVLVGAADHIGVHRDPARVADLVDLLVVVVDERLCVVIKLANPTARLG